MIKRVFRCTYAPTTWHWELVRKGQVIKAGTAHDRESAWGQARLQREELKR